MNTEVATEPQNQINPALKEWLECKDFVLAMKCIKHNYPKCDLSALKNLRVKIDEEGRMVAESRNSKIKCFLPRDWTSISSNLLLAADDWIEAMQAQLTPAIEMLKKVALSEKREVLRYMSIIPSAVGASYIGVSEHKLNKSRNLLKKAGLNPIWGDKYAGGHGYSFAELNVMARNVEPITGWRYVKMHDFMHGSDTALDHAILVDEEVAVAMATTGVGKVTSAITETMHYRRPYRLADLEQIRIAKLKTFN